MQAPTSDVTAALLIWVSDGARPRSGDFRVNRSVEAFPSFAQAVEHAMADGYQQAGRLPGSKSDPESSIRIRSEVLGAP